ncbi:ABC transporter ATP-binding protein [Natrinema halophilum]|uniref:ABC transporter ATP-binding protein n=1 Tax=Natrinema halophilum TaxID=1699371 RepID=A0A7D5KDF8_9EURY|nr:ABC transporter ATP-binding protein [Natrinema halophilum]QLG49396.1 ABC transporter ATP-binding protein [Natrinema halophilum]
MAAIQTTGLTKRYNRSVLAVDDLDLTVEEGEVFGFLGPNGAGKSTTINMLLDFVRPTSGTATVLGLDAQADIAEIRHRIGVLPEQASLYDRLTAREHLKWVIDTKRADDEPGAILKRVGLYDDGYRSVGDYSKGMAQRLGLGMALVGDPELLILDEPSAGLDPTGKQEMRRIIQMEADTGTTVFFSSHILGEVESVCDRVGIMNEGRLVATGTLNDLQGDLNLDATITLEVERAPKNLALHRLDGVRSASIKGTTITVTCTDPASKVDVVQHIASATEVHDIISEDVSLEQLFNTYTNEEQMDEETSGIGVTA